MNPEFILWFNNASMIEIIFVVICILIVYSPLFLLFFGLLYAIIFHEDYNSTENNDCSWL